MHVLALAVLATVIIALIYQWSTSRLPTLPQGLGDWASASSDDPRLAVAAMLLVVAEANGRVTPQDTDQIQALLQSRVGLAPDVAERCLDGGRILARRTHGDLNSRLHQLQTPILRNCSGKEKDDVIDMLRTVAGANADRSINVRDALGRIATSLTLG